MVEAQVPPGLTLTRLTEPRGRVEGRAKAAAMPGLAFSYAFALAPPEHNHLGSGDAAMPDEISGATLGKRPEGGWGTTRA